MSYKHDYGTVVHAMTATAIGAAKALNKSSGYGISGFQAGAVMWEFIKRWGMVDEGPLRLVSYREMLYPQHCNKFEKLISKDTWDWLQEEARTNLAVHGGSADSVTEHWQKIADGEVPFGYEVEEDY